MVILFPVAFLICHCDSNCWIFIESVKKMGTDLLKLVLSLLNGYTSDVGPVWK